MFDHLPDSLLIFLKLMGLLFVVGLIIFLLTWPARKRSRQLTKPDEEPGPVQRKAERDRPYDYTVHTLTEIQYNGAILKCPLFTQVKGTDLRPGFVLFRQPTTLFAFIDLAIHELKDYLPEAVTTMDHTPPMEETRDIGRIRAGLSIELGRRMRALLVRGELDVLPRMTPVLLAPQWVETNRAATGTQQMSVLEITRSTARVTAEQMTAVAEGIEAEPAPTEGRRITVRGHRFDTE